MVGDESHRDLTSSQSFGTSRNSNSAYSIGTYRFCCMITNRTLALLRLAPAHLLDQLAAAPNQIVRVKTAAGLQLFLRLAVPAMPCSDIANGTWIAASATRHRYVLVH
ncbi:hypothetical protein EDB85DRAFT_2278921 [Lactarius pseudohatsudake]|nr:hypothetical protein EDB85DRAFT_2278921 [Lactarius pseudohatsudake]